MRISHNIGLLLVFAFEAMAQAYAPHRVDGDSLPHTTLVTTVWSTAYTTLSCSDTSTWSEGDSSSTWTGFVTTLSVTATLKPTGPETLTVAGTVTESIGSATSSTALGSTAVTYPGALSTTAVAGGGGPVGTSLGAAHTSAVEGVSSSVSSAVAGGGVSSAGGASSLTTEYLTKTLPSPSPSTTTVYSSTTGPLSAPPLVTSAAGAVTAPLSILRGAFCLVPLVLKIAW